MKQLLHPFSFIACCIMALVFTWTVYSIGNFRDWHSPISYDVANYYCYLPAIFIQKDIALHFYDEHPEWYVQKFAPNKAPNGNNVIKMTMGLAFYYAPFFFIAHGYALLFDNPDGFSSPYRFMLLLSAVFYTVVGLFFLRKILLRYFSDAVSMLVLISLGIGTNLFYYTVHEPMSHAYLFFTFIIIMFLTIRWHDRPSAGTAAMLGLCCGLAILVRPTDGIILLIPLFYGITSRQAIINKFRLITTHWPHLLLLTLVLACPLCLQMLYWKKMTGQWLFFSYVGEGFLWNDPRIMEGLFSYRKGWFLYTPIIGFSFLGARVMWKYCREFLVPVLLFTIINVYVVLSWWSWWYGGSFGLRAFIESYALLALPMGAFYQQLFSIAWSRYALLLVITVLCVINQVQIYQYRHAIINYDSMTKKAYWYVFLKTTLSEEEKKTLDTLLEPPEWQRAEKLKRK